MRKGFSLIELITVLAVISIIAVPLAKLNRTMLYDIPRSYKMMQVNTSILSALKQMDRDINEAVAFPDAFETGTSSDELLLIDLAEGVVSYEFNEQEIVRRKLSGTTNDSEEDFMRWPARHAKVQWQVRHQNNKAYAVEIKTWIEHKSGDLVEKKMENSHLYFVGAYREPLR
jgi:prepilin-type N-terminal cleavage/methylation domain-containing protein